MRRIAIMLIAAAAFGLASDVAVARDGCGPGRYYNGHRCVTMRPYAQGPYYGNGYGWGRQNLGNGIYRDPNGSLQCYQPGFTVQGGVCKPYRGY